VEFDSDGEDLGRVILFREDLGEDALLDNDLVFMMMILIE
jgi:hypothetical protein